MRKDGDWSAQGNGNHNRERCNDSHRTLVREYHFAQNQEGRCPPGLAKRNNGCMPPGQARNWSIGRPLPREVIYYALPRPLVLQIGMPPAGCRYVRVAGDILMIAVDSGLVIDTIQDPGRL